MRRTIFSSVYLVLTCAGLASSLEGVLSIPPSLVWDGADGAWSTFDIQVGTPPQTLRVLPGTSATACNSIWIVLPEGCTVNNAGVRNCSTTRGDLFYRNESSTWSTQRLSNGGLYELGLYEESMLGLGGNALIAFESVHFGQTGQGMPTLKNQVVAGIATNDFWLGSLGLSPIAVNFTSIDDPVSSPMNTLRTQNIIGSTSWAYTAGARYKTPPVFGSLTLGGFDNARFNSSSNVTLQFGSDISRDLLIAVRSITYDTLGSSPLLADGIYAFIDGIVAQMWLPITVCQAFEQAFNLTWDATHELYLLTSDQRSRLVAQNPVISFTLGNSTDREGAVATTVIELPYSAFDLHIGQPYVNSTMNYFPLKRAQNDSQYTLGRVFLQEAYVIADYDRHQFTVGQAAFPQGQSTQDLRAILPPRGAENSTVPRTPNHQPASISTVAIAGIAVGATVALGLAALGIWLCIRHRKRKSQLIDHNDTAPSAFLSGEPMTEPGSNPIVELAPNATDGFAEAGGKTFYEMESHKHAGYELPVGRRMPRVGVTRFEMAAHEPSFSPPGARGYKEVYELPAETSFIYPKRGNAR